MRIDALASENHYLDHLAPIWLALDDSERGLFHVAHGMEPLAASAGIAVQAIRAGYPDRNGEPILVASFQDHKVSRRPTIYVEHGAGQTYRGSPESALHPSYSGSDEHEATILFLAPREEVAERWRVRYPETPAVAVGSPRLDPWHRDPFVRELERSLRQPIYDDVRLPGGGRMLVDPITSGRYARQVREKHGVMAISFHADIALCSETRSAWPHFDAALPSLAAAFPNMIGHAHPRIAARLRPHYERAGIEFVASFEEVLCRAAVYVTDNSSTGYEAASTGLPIVWLDAPWYRRDVEHGLRFWELANGGLHCSEPEDLVDVVRAALADPPEIARRRAEINDLVYPIRDGRAAARAVAAIRDTIG